MSGYLLPIDGCPACGSHLEHLQSGRAVTTEASALAVCANNHRWQVLVRLLAVDADPCGSARRRQSRELAKAAL